MKPLDEKALGHQLQLARQAAGLTQQALCQKANLSYSTLAKIERGAIKAPSIFTIQNIAAALGTTLDALIGELAPAAPAPKIRQRSKSGISFVYFDVNGCLVSFFHRAFTRLSEVTNQSPDIIESVFWHFNDKVCRGEMTMDEFNKACAEQLHVPSLDWQEYYLDTVKPIEETRILLEWVNEHYSVGLLTNIMPGLLSAMKQRGLVPGINYDAIVDSSEVHAIKPEAKMYEIASERANCPPDQILLVDDSRANLMAAEKFGWHVLWFDDYHPDESVTRIRAALEPEDTNSMPKQAPESPATPEQPMFPAAVQPTETIIDSVLEPQQSSYLQQ